MTVRRVSKQDTVRVERLERLPPELEPYAESMEQHQKDLSYLAGHYDELEQTYQNRWIAIYESRVVAHAKRNSELWRQLRKLKLQGVSPVTFFIAAEDDKLG